MPRPPSGFSFPQVAARHDFSTENVIVVDMMMGGRMMDSRADSILSRGVGGDVKRSVGVEIAGQHYAIRTDAGEEYVEELARYVDRKIAEARRATRTVSTHQVVILAALNIADELFREQRLQSDLKDRIRERALRALEHLEEEVKTTGLM
jgi:cell division protein ZapA